MRASDNALLATTVFLACPVPSRQTLISSTGYAQDSSSVSVRVSAAYGGESNRSALPYRGVDSGDVLAFDGWLAPPPNSPPSPLSPPVSPPAPPPMGPASMLPDAACLPKDDFSKGWMILQFEDDRSKADAPSDPATIAKGVTNENYYFIGVDELKSREVISAQVCLGSTSGCTKSCYPLEDKYYARTAGGALNALDSLYTQIQGLNTKLKKMAGCFAGLCQRRQGGTNHWFYDCGAQPCGIAASTTSPWYYDGRSTVQIGPHADHPALWGSTANSWHIWGGGVSANFGNNGGEIGRYGDDESTGTDRNLFWIIANPE